jgi:predicted esterase
MGDLGFVHLYQPPADPGAPTLLLLHGTGGDERDLLPLRDGLWPGAGVLSPRGKVLERGMARFFRRLAEGVFDLDDLKARTLELGGFIARASTEYGFNARRVIAVGFSNGANIAASLLLLEPNALAAAVLFRAMVPLVPDSMPAIPGTPVLVSNGRMDPIVSIDQAERLVELLRGAGATVTLKWHPAGHELTSGDITQTRLWLAGAPESGGLLPWSPIRP